MELPRQDYWSGVPFPTPGDLPDPGVEPKSLSFPALAGRFFTTEPPGKPSKYTYAAAAAKSPQSCATPSTIAPQAPVSMEFPRQEYWSGLPFPTPGDLPDLGIEPMYAALQVDSLPLSSVQSSHSVVSNSL